MPEENSKPRFEPLPWIEAYKPGIDKSLLRENLKLTPAERMEQFVKMARLYQELRNAGKKD